MSVKVPNQKSQYLSHGDGATIEKITEMAKLISFVGDYNPQEIIVQITEDDGLGLRNIPLTQFKPDYPPTGNDYSVAEFVDNLFYTIELNPPEQVFVQHPDGKTFIHLIEQQPYLEDTLDEIYSVKGKLDDCLDTIRSGEKLDKTQMAFLKELNIIPTEE